MDAEEWRALIQQFLWSHPQATVSEDGERLFDFAEAQVELRVEHGKLLLHLWSAERNWVRRITGIAGQSPERLVLMTQKFGQARPGRLELAARRQRRGAPARDRRRFQQLLRRLLEQQLPDEQVVSLTHASDLEHSLSGLYVRGEMGRGRSRWAVLASAAGEDAATTDSILTFGLIWLDRLRQQGGRGKLPATVVEGLRLFLPVGQAETTANRLTCLNRKAAKFELYEMDEERMECQAVDARDWGNIATRLVPHGFAPRLGAEQQRLVEQVKELASDAIAIAPGATGETLLRFRGLEFARFTADGFVFGVGPEANALREESFAELEKLVRLLAVHRQARPTDRAHPFFRAQAERWLESMVLADISRIDARLDPSLVYRQVPAVAAHHRGVIDLLGVTREGRLAVIELKASEDIHLPLQGLDYWLRVRWHLEHGDFPRYGYFPSRELRREPPLLLLVAPAFSFHSTTDGLLRYLAEDVPVTRVGLNENWREGLEVVLRQ